MIPADEGPTLGPESVAGVRRSLARSAKHAIDETNETVRADFHMRIDQTTTRRDVFWPQARIVSKSERRPPQSID